jgi:hypothetical protein
MGSRALIISTLLWRSASSGQGKKERGWGKLGTETVNHEWQRHSSRHGIDEAGAHVIDDLHGVCISELEDTLYHGQLGGGGV